jgi:hypothetical protein
MRSLYTYGLKPNSGEGDGALPRFREPGRDSNADNNGNGEESGEYTGEWYGELASFLGTCLRFGGTRSQGG